MQTEFNSDTDQSKQSLSPKFSYQHVEFSELSFAEETGLLRNQRNGKAYHKLRPNSAPRSYVMDSSSWRDLNLSGCCVPDLRRTSAMYIEQDIINKQRQEIQLLMEELGNRDQELNDLVISHQKQVKVWECDTEKQKALQTRLAMCEDELKAKDEEVRKTLLEMTHVNEQREVDAVELKRTQNEMVKLTERIMENSLYIKEMESQNQKLSSTVRDFANARQAFRVREQELLSLLKEKDFQIADKQQEIDKLLEHIRFLELQCRELGERNNNMTEESVNWKKKYSLIKEEVERLNGDCRRKEENIQKMTQQLHESLQQAIALQKALFTSCEREKCKEEVMYSLRKQHKRTMQELQNIRELYDRLSRDTSLYHLSLKDKDTAAGDLKRSEEEVTEEDRRQRKDARYLDDLERWHHEGRRKMNVNMSFHKLKASDQHEETNLAKEMKEKKAKDDSVASTERTADNSTTQTEGKRDSGGMNFSNEADGVKARQLENSAWDGAQKSMPNSANKFPARSGQPYLVSSRQSQPTLCCDASTATSSTTVLHSEPVLPSKRVDFSDRTTHSYPKTPSLGFGNTSKNADVRDSRTPSDSQLSSNLEKPQQIATATLQDALNNPDLTAGGKQARDGVSGVSSSVSNMASASHNDIVPNHDGKSQEHQPDEVRTDTKNDEKDSAPKATESSQSDMSKAAVATLALPKRSCTFVKDKEVKQEMSNVSGDANPDLRQCPQKRAVEFDSHVQVKSPSSDTQSYSSGSESKFHSPSPDKENHIYSKGNSILSQNKCSHLQHVSDDGYRNTSKEKGEQQQNNLSTVQGSVSEREQMKYKGCIKGECQYFQNVQRQQQGCCKMDYPVPAPCKTPENVKVHNLEKYDSCSQCKIGSRHVCDCSRIQKSLEPCLKTPTSNFDPYFSNSGMNYSTQKEFKTVGPNLSFVDSKFHTDYGSCLRNPKNNHFQDLGKEKKYFDSSLLFDPLNESRSVPFLKSEKKCTFLDESFQNSNSLTPQLCTNSSKELPDEVSAYLARQRMFKTEAYYNNNNRYIDQETDSEFENCCMVPERESHTFERGGCKQLQSTASNNVRSTIRRDCHIEKEVILVPKKGDSRLFGKKENVEMMQQRRKQIWAEDNRKKCNSDDTQRNFDTRSRFVEVMNNVCDPSANSNRKDPISPYQSTHSDMNTNGNSIMPVNIYSPESSFEKKKGHVSGMILQMAERKLSKVEVQESRSSVGESYFCPEESESDIDSVSRFRVLSGKAERELRLNTSFLLPYKHRTQSADKSQSCRLNLATADGEREENNTSSSSVSASQESLGSSQLDKGNKKGQNRLDRRSSIGSCATQSRKCSGKFVADQSSSNQTKKTSFPCSSQKNCIFSPSSERLQNSSAFLQ